MTKMPWTLSLTGEAERDGTGHDIRWDCRVKGCGCGGTAHTDADAQFLAEHHLAGHVVATLPAIA